MDTPSKIATRTAARTHVSRGFSTGVDLLRRQIWLWPVLAAVALAAAGLLIRRSVESAAKIEMASGLQAILDSNVEALKIWLETEKEHVAAAASEVEVRRVAGELQRLASASGNDAATLAQSELQEELKAALRPTLKSRRYAGYVYLDAAGVVLAADRSELLGQTPKTQYAIVPRALEHGAVISPPFPSVVLRRDSDGQLRAGQPTMYAAAAVRNLTGDPIGVLCLRMRPETDFARILQVARPAQTGETYAFDQNGLMLSESRFTTELVRMGLVADTATARSQLNIQLRDPGTNLAAGNRAEAPRSDQPLIAAVASGVQGKSGINVEGFRDYRGVPVVGAWTWLPNYDMGVVTQMDVAEAYHSLYILRWAFWLLFGLLAISSVIILLITLAMARLHKAAQKAALAARHLGQYQLEEKLGEGGMGVVYRACHTMLRRATAVKLLHPDKSTERAAARFEREVQLTCRLNHPNTIAIFDYGRTPEGLFYYAMEYLDGINLDALMTRFGPQNEGRVIRILTQVCGSLAEAHAIGLVHRDIKPANIVINHRGGQSDVIKVLDFGLVKALDSHDDVNLTGANAVLGTPLYMPPEAIETRGRVDGRSDLYAVAAVGYFLLTGSPPFNGKTVIDICMQHLHAPPEAPSQRLGKAISAELEAVLLRGLAKNPDDRFADATAFADALLACPSAATWTARDADAWWRQYNESGLATTETGAVAVEQEQTVELVQ